MKTWDLKEKTESSHPRFIVGVGGSAGGLEAYTALLEALPSDTGMAFVIVSHILPTAQNLLANLLSSHTKMPVLLASEKTPILGNHVYVNPANVDLRLENHAFNVSSPRTQNKTVDLFLISLAECMGKRAIGIVLSGYDGDGTEGCRQIKENGGITFAQDLSAQVSGMPLSVQAAGCVDFVLSPAKIAEKLREIARSTLETLRS